MYSDYDGTCSPTAHPYTNDGGTTFTVVDDGTFGTFTVVSVLSNNFAIMVDDFNRSMNNAAQMIARRFARMLRSCNAPFARLLTPWLAAILRPVPHRQVRRALELVRRRVLAAPRAKRSGGTFNFRKVA